MDTIDSKNNHKSKNQHANQAADLIRQKINNIYKSEPNAEEEVVEAVQIQSPRSKHQEFMVTLTNSGKSLAEIQTAWHNYYVGLPTDEKHQVWKEFYNNHDKFLTSDKHTADKEIQPEVHAIQDKPVMSESQKNKTKSFTDIKKQLTSKASSNVGSKLKAKQHFQSLLFGVGMGLIVVLVMLFGFFNDQFIAPFITPSKSVSSTPIIIDTSTTAPDGESKIIIPKINVEIPVVYDEPNIEEKAIQNALERGVVHYATTPNPGQNGNSVIFGHSSNNILNSGKYKFAFVLLKKLEVGDTFYLTHEKVRYAYKVFEKKIVSPTDLSVLGNTSKTATATLITCDPPGTSLNRLIVIGEQISPNPSKNAANPNISQSTNQLQIIPSNSPSLWQRILDIF